MKSGRHSKYPSSLAGGIYRGFAARKVPLPILLAASPLACRLCRENFISCALTIPPATQATALQNGYVLCRNNLKQCYFYPSWADRGAGLDNVTFMRSRHFRVLCKFADKLYRIVSTAVS